MINKPLKFSKNIILIIILFFLNACEKDKLEAPQSCYTVKYTEPVIEQGGYSHTTSYTNYIGFTQFSDNPLDLTKYVSEEKFKLFYNSILEIQDIFTIRFHIKDYEIYNYFISVNKKNKAFYLIWKRNDIILFNKNLDLQLNLNSDTVYSNIDRKLFQLIFPKFKGKVINGKVNEISVKHDYQIFDHLFYLDIKFIGLEIGDYEYWRNSLDTLLFYNKYWDKIKQKKLDSITRYFEDKYLNKYKNNKK